LTLLGFIYKKNRPVKIGGKKLSGFTANITGDQEIYHIYIKGECVYNSLNESQFKQTWASLKGMVGLMQTSYTLKDLSYEKCSASIGGGGGKVTWKEPEGGDSY